MGCNEGSCPSRERWRSNTVLPLVRKYTKKAEPITQPPAAQHWGLAELWCYTNQAGILEFIRVYSRLFAEPLLREQIAATPKRKIWYLTHSFSTLAAHENQSPGQMFLNINAWVPPPEILHSLKKKKQLHQEFWCASRIGNHWLTMGRKLINRDQRSEPWFQKETSQSRSTWQRKISRVWQQRHSHLHHLCDLQ